MEGDWLGRMISRNVCWAKSDDKIMGRVNGGGEFEGKIISGNGISFSTSSSISGVFLDLLARAGVLSRFLHNSLSDRFCGFLTFSGGPDLFMVFKELG